MVTEQEITKAPDHYHVHYRSTTFNDYGTYYSDTLTDVYAFIDGIKNKGGSARCDISQRTKTDLRNPNSFARSMGVY